MIFSILGTILNVLEIPLYLSSVGILIQIINKSPFGLAKINSFIAVGYSIMAAISFHVALVSSRVSSLVSDIVKILSIITILYVIGLLALSNSARAKLKTLSKDSGIITLALFAGIVSIIGPILKLSEKNFKNPAFTQGNNDLGQYVIAAEAFKRGGFLGDGYIQNANQFDWVRTNDFGVPGVIGILSSTSGIPTWEMITPFLAFISMMLFLATYAIIFGIFGDKFPKSILAVFTLVSTCGAVSSYLISNNFIAQLVTMWLWFTAINELLTIQKKPHAFSRRNSALILSFIYSGIILTYPHFFLICMVVLVISVTLSSLEFKSHRQDFNLFVKENVFYGLIIPSLMAVTLSFGYIESAYKLIFYRASASNGWPMPGDFSLMNILVQGDYNGKFQAFIYILSVIVLIIFVIFCYDRLSKIPKIKKKTGFLQKSMSFEYWLLLGTPILLSLVLIIIYGNGSYKAWKTVFSFTPLIIAFAVFYFFGTFLTSRIAISYALATSLLIYPLHLQNQAILNPINSEIRLASSDMYNLHYSMKKYEIKSININANSYFESMLLSAIVPTYSVYVNVPTYFKPKVYDKTCTLIRNSFIDNKNISKTKIIRLNETYSIIQIPNVCEIRMAKVT